MAFDQNSVTKDLRPLSVIVPSMVEEPLILPSSTTKAVNAECFPPPNSVRELGSPGAVPIFYPTSVSDASMVGLGYGNVASTWCVRPIGQTSVNHSIGYNNYSPNFANHQIMGGNAADLSSRVIANRPGYTFNWVGGNGMEKSGNDVANVFAYSALHGNRAIGNARDQGGNISPSGIGYSPTASQRTDQGSEEGGDDSVSGRKVKFLCSYGGKILPRPSDGVLRYVGGQTRIISVKRDVSFNDLVQKMVDMYGQSVVIKYQLPDEDLDALVSVSCPDDIENMIDEYEKLIDRSTYGYAKLRVFLFPASELGSSGVEQFGDLQGSGQKYVDAVNGITDGISSGITRKESTTSAASTQLSDLSGNEALDSSITGQGDVSGAPLSWVLSPKGNGAASHDTTANLVASESNVAAYSDASTVSSVMPVANSVTTHTPYFQNDAELEKSTPVTLSHQQFGLKQSGMEIPPPTSYLRPFVDPHQEVMTLADNIHLPSQMGFSNPQLLGNPGPVFTQQQFPDNTPSLMSHKVIPSVQMETTGPSSHVSERPTIIQPQPLMQLQQNRLEHCNDENTSGLRIIRLPAEDSYTACQVQVNQVPSVIVGGKYGWVQVPPQEHVVFRDGLLPQQQAMISENIQREEEKKLPHAHSDPIQDQCNSGSGPSPDSILSYHSLPMEDNLKAQATNRVMDTAPLKEGIIEQGICNPQIHCMLPFDKPSGNDKLNNNTEHAMDKEVFLNNFSRSKLIVDPDQIKMTDMLPCSPTRISYGHNSRPGEYNEVAQPPVWGIPGSNPQSKSGNHHKDDAASSSISPSIRFKGVQESSNSLFSNQDPWNIHYGKYGEQNLEPQLDNGIYQPFKQNLTLEHGRSAKGLTEDQQLQAVAEGVADSVLHPGTPANAGLHTKDVTCYEDIEDVDVQNNLIDVQYTAKTQDVKSKPEKANFGFLASDVEGLQVIKNCDLEEQIELGSGTFGTVYHAKWRGTDVAIKRITDRCFAGKPSEQERMRADFWNEAIKLADLHHPNVVTFYGVVLDGPGDSVATVTEYMVNGSLRNALQKNERNLDKRKRLLIAMDVAFGMEYLHGKNIIHFDLKSDNLLVNLRDPHRPICKVGDLGLSKVKCKTLISGGVRGTLPWMAPELLNGRSSLVSEKVDVFSFGIVMWELLTGEEPYADLHYGAIIGGIVSNTLRPSVPESCDPQWSMLMERCWSSEPSERPSFTQIANELRSMSTRISPKG